MLRTGPPHPDLLQVLVLHVVEVREARNVEVITHTQEVLLQLDLHQQLQQPIRALLALHAAQLLGHREEDMLESVS